MPVTRGQRRGRPELRYRVAEGLLGNNLALISDSLLKAWKTNSTAAAKQRLIGALAQGLADQLGPIKDEAGAVTRMAVLVDRLNLLHYRSHWEAGAEGPRLMFGHCPYAALIEDHPELCQMDARAVSEAMRTSARQIAKIDLKGSTGSKCVFSLR